MAQFLVRKARDSYPEVVVNTEKTMNGTHTHFPQCPVTLEGEHDASALRPRHRFVWTVLDELRRAFAAGSIAERNHHNPDIIHMLYQDNPHDDR